MENKKGWIMLGYVAFFLPLIFCKNDDFARFHANQSLVLLISYLLMRIIANIVPIIGTSIIAPLIAIIWLLFVLYGMSNVYLDKKIKLPIIGEFILLKH